MGFLSKLLGGESKKILGDIIDSVQSGMENAANSQNDTQTEKESGPSKSWGPKKPDEENQYNFRGKYYEYFDSIYKAEFPEYDISYENIKGDRSTVFTFYKHCNKELVVELLSETSSTKKLKKECEQEGIPYLRFYYNHRGWWNTRSYVIERTKNALKN